MQGMTKLASLRRGLIRDERLQPESSVDRPPVAQASPRHGEQFGDPVPGMMARNEAPGHHDIVDRLDRCKVLPDCGPGLRSLAKIVVGSRGVVVGRNPNASCAGYHKPTASSDSAQPKTSVAIIT
ncbi:MAG: hypothetical protein ACR2RA_14905, partial [Geminicoccaceae bacterium]